ncbi:MAG: aminotransferase class V-fold PLP-dependent enzyme [Candidatus Aminicenantes bacterium]|nr:aminotransferase class V-fold PLP-dependent enzyme [Candidatus Aminicenantes bacterium]
MANIKNMTRRNFLGSLTATGAALLTGPRLTAETLLEDNPGSRANRIAAETPDFEAVRADFPRAARKLWLAAAETHPFNVNILRAIESYAQFRALGPGEGRSYFSREMQSEAKRLFADLIHAKPEEIAFVMSTTEGENIVAAGLDLARRGGNVVIDDLHFPASWYLYAALEKQGIIELRVVRHRDWKIKLADMEKAIDKNTRLVSIALVSNINGYMHEAKAISDLAHANGALVYGDIIQAVGNTPVDVQAMGIDCAASSTYKWLMGDFGLGFLYVRNDLQGTAIKQTRYGLRALKGLRGREFELRGDATIYEGTTSMPNLSGLCAYEGMKYVTKLGIDNIRAHAKPLTDRLQKEMPALGYAPITPLDSPSPIVSFLTPDPDATRAKLDNAFGEHVVSLSHWQKTDDKGETETVSGIRIAVSVYNNDNDIDQFLNALSS